MHEWETNTIVTCVTIAVILCTLISWIGFNCYEEKQMFKEFAKAGLVQVQSPITGTTQTNNIWVKP